MGRYGGWGAADEVFAPGASGNDLRDRERLRAVVARLGGSTQAGERLFSAAGLTVLNAHYTDPVLVRAIYRALADLGLERGTIVEAGVGAGQFAAFAPDGIRITGIELDPATALIAQLLHPDAEILIGSVSGPRFSRVRDQSASPVRVPRDTADGFAGNVPFSDVKWPDDVLNPGARFPLHDHAILWGVTRVAPGGLCAFITSRYTADKRNPGFRRTLAGELDLIGMVRLPSTAHKRMAGTRVVTDIIIGRRLADGERPRTDPGTWEQARPLPLPGSDLTALVNAYFHDNPQHVLGTLKAGGMRRADDFSVEPSGDLEEQLGAALGEIAGRALAAGQRHEPRPAARPVIEIVSRRPDGTITANPDGTFTQVVHGQDTPLEISSAREADQVRGLVALAEARAALIRAEAGCPEDTDETDALRARMGDLYDGYTGAYGAIGRFTVRTTSYHVKTLKGVLDRLDFSKADVPDPEVALLEAYLGRDALTQIVESAADPGHVRHGTRKDKQGNEVATQTRLVQVARVRAALAAALAGVPQGADAERLTAAFGERMSRIETGEQRSRLMPVAFRSDPRRPAVEALENFDPVTQTAVKKPVFSRRTAVPHRLELGADTPQEALDLVLIHRRRVDLPEIARLLGTSEADARKQLGTLVFDDPAAGGLIAAGEYLSGNVREKLAAARTAATRDTDRYTVNVESLQAVQPPALAAEDIQARLGSAWLSRQIVQDGLRQILEDPTLTVTHPGGAEWTVSTRKDRNSAAQDRYGTSDWNAVDLAQALLTNASIAVYRTYIDPATGNEKKYRDDAATLFSYRKAQRLDADFTSWLWSDPGRADECARLYNSAYNNQVKRTWDSAPFYIPGLAPGMRLHPFQNALVRRLHTESGLAAWVVGAGKTELGIVAAMEGHRLGRHQLAAIVCPASLVNQWRDRIYRTYPQAQVLVADDDLRARKDAREIFTERAASRDYQLAVTPYEFFGSLTLSADAARASADEEIDKLTRYAKEATAQGDRHTAKALQGKIAWIEAQYSAAALAAGGAVTFTDARIDSVIVDEWHSFRRITRDSNNRAMAIIKGSARADHMLAVFDYLRKRHPEGLLLGLSGTPLEQSIADAWAAMRFFAPERLKELGLEEFDAFLTTFGRTEARREPTPTGSGLHVRERASDWFNLPEMRRALWDPFADVVRSADLGLNVPRLTGGRPQAHVLPQTPGQASVQADIDDGYARFKAGDRGPDNHILRLMDRAAKNALHPRMLGMETDGKIKLEAWADDAAAWYHATRDARFLDREGNPHPRPGALRMVACELGVPDPARPNAWSVYSEMRSLLAARGVPAAVVRFAQDAAGSDRKKAALWEDARTGRCNFVIGSAQTAGTGVDVPDRLQVLDYMTLSWNPTQFEQWLGRIVRQGNQNPEVTANVWSTEGTIEVLRADKIAMKSAPFEALIDGTSQTRRVNEETYDPLSAWAADMATRMSGNPLLNAQREAQLEVETAQGMQGEWQRENGIKARRITVMNTEIQEMEEKNAAIDRALSRAVDTRGDKFTAQVGTTRYTARAEAGAALLAALAATAAGDDVSALADGNPQHLGELAGFPVTAWYKRHEPGPPAQAEDGQDAGPEPGSAERTWIFLGFEGVPNGRVDMMTGGELPDRDPVGLMTSLEGRIRRLPGERDKNTAAIAENRDQITKTRAELAKPSPYLQQLADARDALDRIEAQIDELLKDTTTEPDAALPADAEPAPVSSGEPGPDDGARPAVSGASPEAGDIASLPPWTASSPHSAAITAACQAAIADSNLTQVARSNDLNRFLEWLSGSGWALDHAAAAIGDDSQVPPFAQAVLDDPVFAVDLTCAVGAVVHARRVGQALPPGSAARRPIPPMVEMSALRHWQGQDEATGRAASTDQWYDLVTAAQIDIWLSRAGLPREGRRVRSDPSGHAVLELTAADGEQWRLTVPCPKDARHEATARYSLTRSGQDGWMSRLNGTPGDTTPEQAAALLIGTLTQEGALLPPAPAPDLTAPAAQPASLPSAPAPPADEPHKGTSAPAPAAEDEDQAAARPTTTPSGSGMSREDLDFAYQHAYEFVLGTVRDPGSAQEERALDYAAWYMATFGDEESLDDLPGHDHAWGWFIDQGFPARDPAAAPSGQREKGRPGMEATAEATGLPEHAGPEPATARQQHPGQARPDQDISPEGQSPDAAPHPAAGIHGQDSGTGPAAAWEFIPPVTVLHGHVSEETAIEVPDYPYGSLRCTMRYWLETDRKGQVRRVHQTTNPKRPGEPRNKPHRDTYNSWAVLYRAANGHVELHATGYWGPSPALDARIRLDGTYDQLDDAKRAAYDRHVARSLKANTRGWEDWRADLAYVRSQLAEHGTLPSPGQLVQVRGARLDEAEAVAAVAAVAVGLGGNHAAPPAAPGQPAITASDSAAEESVLLPVPAAAPAPESTGPVAAHGNAAGLRQLAAVHGLAADTARTGTTLTVTVHDQGRTVLLHDDINGTTAGGRRLDPAEIPPYLAAYARHPQLPPRCLLDLARRESAEPVPLTLTAAREAATRHGLEVRVRRVGGQSYITFCEPGTAAEFPGDIAIPGVPVLSYPAGSGSARHGPCTVPVAAIGSYLAAYRENVPLTMFAVPERYDWRRRVVPLTPHLIDGSGHFIPAVRDRLRAALAAARDERTTEARALLAEAEALIPVALLPEREAKLSAVVRRDTARYGHSGDPAASLAAASLRGLHVTARELDWVRAYIAGHPEVREHAEETKPDAGPDSDREAATSLAQQAQEAANRGDYQRALALIDDIELLRPSGKGYEAVRDKVRTAMSNGRVDGNDTDETAVASPTAARDPDAERREPGGTAPESVRADVEPEAASPGTAQATDASGTAAEAGSDQAGRYTRRIRISFESGPPTLSGTDYNDDPPELREALRANGFEWRKRRQVWEYTGRRRGPGPLEAAEAIRDLLARLDREPVAPTAKEFPPTPQQQAILDAFLDGKGVAVQALAGTGKTTTLVLLARALMDRSPQARIVYTAFNASIVADARRGRFGDNVTASTMHSLARQALLQTSYAAKVEHADKGARWPEQWAEVLAITDVTAETRDGAAPADAVEVARLVIATVRRFRESADDEPGRQHLPYLAGPAGSPLSKTVLSYARKAWANISDTGNARLLAAGRALRVDHDDYLKVWALSRPRINAEAIFFDEAQDVNDVMRRVVLDQPAQTVVVGDSHQSIYGFRGAIDALKDWPADIVLPLTQSWRFGQEAANFGNLFLRSLGSKLLLEGNPARDTRLGSAAEPDAILCRTNATAVAEVFAGLESGKRTALVGGGQAIREIAKAARDLQAGKGTKHPDLSRFADWDEVRHYAQHDEDGKSLQVFVRLIDRHGPGGLIDMIGRLTPEGDTRNPAQLTISTAHKAKGLEWDVVRIAGDFRGPVTDPETGEVTWPAPEERRLAYVAATRARKLLEPGSLTWINDYPLPRTRDTQDTAQGKDRPATADVPASDAASDQATRTAEPDASYQDPAYVQEATSAAPGQASATARNAWDTAPATSPDAAGTPPEAGAAARLRPLAARHGLTVTADRLSPTNELITVADDQRRIVLLHDDISETRADGIRIGLDEADAYLSAWRAYPGMPARALLDWVRRSQDEPEQLTLSAARAIAEDCGLRAEPVRAAGQPFIVFRERGRAGTVLACRPSAPAASTGLVTVPVPSIGAYLRAYRAAVQPRWRTIYGERDDWASELAALAPYLISATSLHSAEAHRHVAAAADAAVQGDHGSVKDELRRAWAAAGPFTPAPDREAALVRIITDAVPRYQQLAGDGARYAAEIARASDPEWDWIYQWVREHPDILTAATPTHEVLEQRDASERAQATAEGEALAKAAKDAFDAGDYPAALALIDQGEIADPGRARWQQARALILEKSAGPGDVPQPETAAQAGPATEAGKPPPQQATAAAEPGAAGSRPAADTSPGTGDGAEPGEPSLLAVPAGREEGVRFFHDVAERYGLRVSAVIDTLQWWTVHLSTLDGGSGVLVASYDSRNGQWRAANGSSLGPGQVAAYLAACGEDVSQSAMAAGADPYTDPGQARVDYHKALGDYRALRDTQAGRTLVETLAGVKPRPDSNRPDAIALDAAYQAVRVSWRKAFAGDAQDVADRFAAWAQAASVMAGNLAAEKHRARKFRAALDAFTVSAGRLASRTQATARDPGAWARVFSGLPGSAQDAAKAPGEAAAPGHATPDATTATARSGSAPAHETDSEPAREQPSGPAATPLANMDLAAELDRMPGAIFARWVSMAGTSPAAGDLDYQRPGAGSWATVGEDGIEITVSGPEVTRHGLVTWPQAASWIGRGVTPARLGIIGTADRLTAFVERHRDQLTSAGTCDPGAVAAELAQIRGTAVAAIVDAARRSRGAAAPVPPAGPGDPAWHMTAMITRPDRTASKAENAALDRLTRLRTAIREPQSFTAAEVRAAIRRWTRYDGLPDLVRALDNPAAMRAWISEQASRRGEGHYDNSADCWYGSSPDGLIIDRNGDDRAPALIRWEEIPAWIQPGIASRQRDQLHAADAATTAIARRRLTAAVPPDVGLTTPADEEAKQASKRLSEAIDAAWAAIEATPPPSPAELDNARHAYRDTGPIQPALFDAPQQDSAPAQVSTRAPGSRQPRPAPPRPEQDTAAKDQAARPSGADPVHVTEHDPAPATVPAPVGPAHADDPERPQTPATNSDLAIALHSMSDQELTSFLTLEKTPDGHGSLTDRRNGLPDAGASQMLYFDHSGVRITVSAHRVRRHGQIPWRQVASWIDTGLTPARLGIIIGASQLGTFTNARRDQLIAAGKDNIDAAITELRQISNDAIDAALNEALAAQDADAPVHPAIRGKPAYRTTAMLTSPDPAATTQENAALARIGELAAAIRGTQPTTPADIKATIRWWIGDNLPEYARALASPEAMRAWIRRQASGPASRPGPGTYDNGRYHSASPEGLRTSQGSDTRIAPLVRWEEIPAWIMPGLSVSLRDRLAAAEPRPAPGRTRTAANPPLGAADLAGQADKPLPGPLREAINAAWAAIETAATPSPADLDHARALYRAAGTTQQALPSSPAKAGPVAALALRPGAGPIATAGPLTDDDIFLGISRLPAFVIGDLFHAIDIGQPLGSVSRQLASYSGERAAREPDPGAREAVTAEPAGLRIQVEHPGGRRTGLITWQQVDDLLRPGTTSARRQIVTQACQVRTAFMAANASFRAVGEGHLAAAAEDELRVQATAAVTAILAAAHPGSSGQAPQAGDDATADRIVGLAAALPSEPLRPRTPAGQVTTGDVIGHPGYRFQPFRIAEPPHRSDAAVEITGRLTNPASTEPAGPITLTLPRAGRSGPFVSVIPAPAHSLRPLFPEHEAAAGTGQPADARPDRAPAETAGPPSDAVPAPHTKTPARQPEAQDRTQEKTMPPSAHSTAPSGSSTSPELGTAPPAPSAVPPPVPPETAGQRDADRVSPGGRADRPGDGASVTDELERVLDAIREHRGAAADGHASDDFSDIRRAFAAMRDTLGLSASSPEPGPGQPAPAPSPAAVASRPPRGEPAPAIDSFTDIQAAFADLREILGLPAHGRHARSDGAPGGIGTSVADALDRAAAEAQACAHWYRDTPEWQRIGTVSRAARDLVTAIREAAGDYWAEIRLDVRVRGFARTLAARTALAVSGAAHILAGRLERAGHRDTRTWRAAWRLHRATTTFANSVMRYTPPGHPDRMREARRIIDDLGQRQNRPGQPGPGRHAAPRGTDSARTPNAAALGRDSFPVMVTRASAGQATAAPITRATVPAPRQPTARRQ
jgi:N12 class adenine-specific DNA methylase/superfamily I DNA/RNA helicase